MLFEYTKDPIMTNMPLAEIFRMEATKYEKVDILAQKLSRRAKNSCKRNHIDTVEDLLNQTPSSLLAMRSFGKGCLIEIEQFIAAAPDIILMTRIRENSDDAEPNEYAEAAVSTKPTIEPSHFDSLKDETCRSMVFQAMKAYYASALNEIVECLRIRKDVSTRYLSIFTKIPANELDPLMEILEDSGVVEHWKTDASKYYNYIGNGHEHFVVGHGAIETMDW